jgi:lipoprotein-anchoring transpeptidase ErfK/SrfK
MSATSLRTARAVALAALVAIATATAGAGPALAGTPAGGNVSGGALAPAHSPLNGGSLAPASGPSAVPARAREIQSRLVALRYLPPEALTGRWDYRTAQALTAFQSWQGLLRDGVAGPQTLSALRTATVPKPTRPTSGRSIEVYRAKGVTLLIEGFQVVRAIHSSSGRPGYSTPTGSYRVFRKEARSWSYPYSTWLPYASYFNAGIAFHAYTDVPAQPASHGCIRVPVPEAPFLYAFAAVGTPVTVY